MKKALLLFFVSLIGLSITAQEILIKPSITTESTKKSEFIAKSKDFTLWYQAESATGFSSQDFEEGMSQYDSQAADDFVISNGPWSINAVSCYGTGGSSGGLEYVHVYFYENDSGTPEALIQEFISIPCVTENKSGTVTIDLPETVVLENGTYWISIVADMDHDPNGQWFWNEATSTNGALWQWRNPNDGFGTGYTDWGSGQDAMGASEHDLSLGIYGKPGSNSWITSLEIMPEASIFGSSAYNTDENSLYTIGGEPTFVGMFIYDVENDLWTSGADLLDESTYGSAVYANGKVYANQGEGPSGYTDVFWAYDTSADSWTVKQSMPEALAWGGMTYCEVHNVVYFAGGYDMATFKNTVYVYDIATDSWDSATPLPEVKAGGKIVCVNETLFFIGGVNDGGTTLSNKVFKGEINTNDPLDISWSAVSTMPVAIYKHHVATFGSGKIIVNGGNDTDGGFHTAIPSTYIYDINEDSWTQVADKTMAVNSGACGTFNYDGNTIFVVASGYSGTEAIRYAEMFYAETKYIVSYEVIGGNGVISATVDASSITSGEYVSYDSDVVFSATPDTDYSVKEWKVNGTAQAETGTEFTYSGLDQDINVTVEFQEGVFVEDINNDNIKAFPNPFRNEIMISNANDLSRIRIDNLIGIQILELETKEDVIINTTDLAPGVYFITFIFNDNSRSVRKMIKQ